MRSLSLVKSKPPRTRERSGEELFRSIHRKAYPDDFKPKLYVVKSYKDRTVNFKS